MRNIRRRTGKVFYYARNIVRDSAPQSLFRRRLDQALTTALRGGPVLLDRLNYYNKLREPFTPSPAAATIATLPRRPSMYYYDLKEFARYFDPNLRLDLEFGDVRGLPGVPSIVKNRPIGANNANAVLFKMDKLRHFQMPDDPVRFADKQPGVVWRGDMNNPMRLVFLDAAQGLPFCDVGSPATHTPERHRKPFMSVEDQKRYRYIVSLEGYDVATNLKWIMSSNSLCLMPEPTNEIWFCEGHLKPDEHYVQLAPDFSDIAEKFAFFERHPEQAERIIASAQAYCRQFLDEPTERALCFLVLYKYFVLSGQVEPDDKVWRFISA